MLPLTGRCVKRFNPSSSIPQATKLHPQKASRLAAIERQLECIGNSMDKDAENQAGNRDITITHTQLYDMCCGTRSIPNFDGGSARFHISPKKLHAAHFRLQAQMNKT